MKPTYDQSGVTIYKGDCLQVLRRLRGKMKFHAVITDPPYNVRFKYGSHNDAMPEREYFRWLRERFDAACDLVIPNGSLVFFWPPFRVARGELLKVLPKGWQIHHFAGWHRKEYAGDVFAERHPAYTWEAILWCRRSGEDPLYFGRKGGETSRDMILSRSSRHDWTKIHPCMKPEYVMKVLIEWTVPQGGWVLDPFSGSGTTLRAAKDLGRKSVGIEKHAPYVEAAARRMAQEVLL